MKDLARQQRIDIEIELVSETPGSKEISLRPIHSAPDPEYSEEARKPGYQGTLKLSFVAQIRQEFRKTSRSQSPLALELDEKSVEAVGAWKFQPGQKAAQAVSVETNVEMSFRLGWVESAGVGERIMP